MSYCEGCGKENCRTTKVAGHEVCAECKRILKEKGIA